MKMRNAYPLLSPDAVRRAEQSLFDAGFPESVLMEHAALAVTEELEKLLHGCAGKTALFLCGGGICGEFRAIRCLQKP